eukprot:symbB.v1.2.022643.t1/scaffold2018.1/size92264/3
MINSHTIAWLLMDSACHYSDCDDFTGSLIAEAMLALLWICGACHLHVLAERQSRGIVGVLNTDEEERSNRNGGQFGGTESTANNTANGTQPALHQPDNCSETQVQQSLQKVLQGLGVSSKHGGKGDYCSWPGITCKDCEVTKISFYKDIKGTLVPEWKDLTELREVVLSFTSVQGDIAVFRSLSKLEVLRLRRTRVKGDVESLSDPDVQRCALRLIDLGNTAVGGNIRVFQAFTDLTHLYLDNTLVFGDIRAFEATQKLIDLNLDATGVSGNIKSFQRTTQLDFLTLSQTHVVGDIEVFTSTPSLRDVYLDATQVAGDIKVFEHHPELCSLEASSTNVRGDISVFNSTKGLRRLSLSDTNVSGGIEVFASLGGLSAVILRDTQVDGNLSSFQHTQPLQNLDLSATGVEGDIKVFEDKENLAAVKMSSTKIMGDVRVFERCKELIWLELSSTNVTGDIKVFRGKKVLKHLTLASTMIFGDLGDLVSENSTCALKVLDLSNTRVSGSIFILRRAVYLIELHLQDTQVTGSIDGIIGWKNASVVDLSKTMVTGRLTERWRGCCKDLRSLKLSESRAEFVPSDSDLIQLMDLRDGSKDKLLPALTTLEVSGCPLNAPVQDLVLPLAWCEHLGSIIAVNCGLYGGVPDLDPLPPSRINGIMYTGRRSKLASSLDFLDLSSNNLSDVAAIPPSTRKLVVSSNKQPLRLADGALTSALQDQVAIDLRGTTLHENTHQEAQKLLRNGALRRKSERTFLRLQKGYNCYELDQSKTILEVLPSEFLPEELCQCLPDWSGRGTNCSKINPNCNQTFRVQPLNDTVCKCPLGSAIVDKECLECFAPVERCQGGTSAESYCGQGYHGPLCMRCSEQYYAASGSCIQCKGAGLPPLMVKALTFVSIGALAIGACVAIAYFVYAWSPFRRLEGWMKMALRLIFAPGALGDWQQQLVKRQAPILLQTCQLWSVLSALASSGDSKVSGSFWELPYMQHLQLTVGNIRELLSLQCFYDGKQVRLILACITPAMPLVLLLCCVGIEVGRRGSGVNAALKILTIFFVGGASKCANLVSCQQVDAGGWPLQTNMPFLRYLPDVSCNPKSMVSEEVRPVFWPCAVCYCVLIPCFLLYLYARQHWVLRYSRMPLELTRGSKSEHLAVSHQDHTLQLRLVAGLVAYVSMLQHGSVKVQLRDGKGTVTFLDAPDGEALELDADATNAQFEMESEKLRHNAITEMLLERHILEKAAEDDRFLLGAKETLLKYSTCRDLWMEVMLKLAVASSTATRDLLIPIGKVLAATLVVVATVWMVRPYAQPQVNDLQICCFMGLAFAATGFALQMAWLSRVALLMPLLLAAAQQMQPDSPESLAQRLWEDLIEDGMPKESATTSMLTRRESLAIRFSLDHD